MRGISRSIHGTSPFPVIFMDQCIRTKKKITSKISKPRTFVFSQLAISSIITENTDRTSILDSGTKICEKFLVRGKVPKALNTPRKLGLSRKS